MPFHPCPPSPCGGGLLGGEVMLKALAQGMPDRVPACSGGDVCSVMALGVDPRTGGPWLEGMNDAVGFGAHAGGDGEDGIMHLSEPGCRNNPVEVLEVKGPLMIDHYGYRPDTGGPGKHRGGVGISRVYRFLAPSTAISIVYKTLSPPWGINGGREADPNHIVIDPGTENEERKGSSYNFLEAGQVLANNTGGGGGWGNPFERDPALVAKDVRNGFVSVEAAEQDYGVAVDPATFSVDTARTATLRG